MDEMMRERTLVLVKPDGVQRALVGEIIKRYEQKGLKIVGLKMVMPTPEKVEAHYTIDPTWKKTVGERAIASYDKKGIEPPTRDAEAIGTNVLNTLKTYLTVCPVVAMVLEGAHVVEVTRKVTGGTEPRTSDMGTIRGDFVIDSYMMADVGGRAIRNIIHASGSVEEANQEIPLWFAPEELMNYKLITDRILYDVNLDGLSE
jgi:nucleoside-diphosphate kinase